MSNIKLLNESCLDQEVDVIVNAANRYLAPGDGICGVIFRRAGYVELSKACNEYELPLLDGDAVITPAFGITNAKYIIHAVGPDFSYTPDAFDELLKAYYNSLEIAMENNLHSIAFPLISAGIYGMNLDNPPAVSTKQAIKAYKKFLRKYKNYEINVTLCAYTEQEYIDAKKVFKL